MSVNPDRPTNYHQIDFGWKVLLRYDQYIAATNAKASFILALDAGIMTLTSNWLSHSPQKISTCISSIWPLLTFLLILITCATIITTLLVVSPRLTSPKNMSVEKSLVFFGNVAEISCADYLRVVASVDCDNLRDDLHIQVHTVARILNEKFLLMRHAFWWVIYFQVPLLLLMSALKILF